MADTNNKIVTLEHLEIVKTYIDLGDSKAIKSGDYSDNTLKFYTSEDKSGNPVMTFNLPEERFLDTAKSGIVDNFKWDISTYPNSTNPNLDGEPVLVLVLKGDAGAVSYSFISLKKVFNVYTGENTQTINMTVSVNGKISGTVNISAEEDNLLTSTSDGLYVPRATGKDDATATVTVSDDNEISVAVKKAAKEGNAVTLETDGIYVAQITAGDSTDTATVSITDNKVIAEVNVSEEDDNALVVTDDGLGVFASSEADNILEVKEDGSLYVPAPEDVQLNFATEADIKSLFPTGD